MGMDPQRRRRLRDIGIVVGLVLLVLMLIPIINDSMEKNQADATADVMITYESGQTIVRMDIHTKDKGVFIGGPLFQMGDVTLKCNPANNLIYIPPDTVRGLTLWVDGDHRDKELTYTGEVEFYFEFL